MEKKLKLCGLLQNHYNVNIVDYDLYAEKYKLAEGVSPKEFEILFNDLYAKLNEADKKYVDSVMAISDVDIINKVNSLIDLSRYPRRFKDIAKVRAEIDLVCRPDLNVSLNRFDGNSRNYYFFKDSPYYLYVRTKAEGGLDESKSSLAIAVGNINSGEVVDVYYNQSLYVDDVLRSYDEKARSLAETGLEISNAVADSEKVAKFIEKNKLSSAGLPSVFKGDEVRNACMKSLFKRAFEENNDIIEGMTQYLSEGAKFGGTRDELFGTAVALGEGDKAKYFCRYLLGHDEWARNFLVEYETKLPSVQRLYHKFIEGVANLNKEFDLYEKYKDEAGRSENRLRELSAKLVGTLGWEKNIKWWNAIANPWRYKKAKRDRETYLKYNPEYVDLDESFSNLVQTIYLQEEKVSALWENVMATERELVSSLPLFTKLLSMYPEGLCHIPQAPVFTTYNVKHEDGIHYHNKAPMTVKDCERYYVDVRRFVNDSPQTRRDFIEPLKNLCVEKDLKDFFKSVIINTSNSSNVTSRNKGLII